MWSLSQQESWPPRSSSSTFNEEDTCLQGSWFYTATCNEGETYLGIFFGAILF